MSQGVYVLGGKCPGGKCPGGKCLGGICPWGKCPGGLCPRTILNCLENGTQKRAQAFSFRWKLEDYL